MYSASCGSAQASPAQPGAAAGGQGRLIVLAVVVDVLAPPHLPADLDDLAGAAQRRVERYAVKSLDRLRAGGADAEPETSVGDVVDTGGGHRQQRRGAGVPVRMPDLYHQPVGWE